MRDFFRCFRTCFQCSSDSNLKRINFSGKFIYYHNSCLQSVLNSPEQNLSKLPKALMIYDQIRCNMRQQQCQQFVTAFTLKDIQKENIQHITKIEELAKFKQIFQDGD